MVKNGNYKVKEEQYNMEQDELYNMIQTGKPAKKPKLIYEWQKEACLQNVAGIAGWRSGDPNPETTPTYDFVWIVWILRHHFPKDVVTHLVNLVGGFTFRFFAAENQLYLEKPK
jgi:hypothetical protein